MICWLLAVWMTVNWHTSPLDSTKRGHSFEVQIETKMLFNYWYWLPYESAVQSTLATALYWNCATVFFCDCLTAARPLSSQPRDSLFSNIKFEPLLFHTISYQCYIWYHLIHMCNSPMPPQKTKGPAVQHWELMPAKKRSQHKIHAIHVPVESCYGLLWSC